MERYCSSCKSTSVFEEHIMKKYGSKRCSACIREGYNRYNRNQNFVRRVNERIANLCQLGKCFINLKEADIIRLMIIFDHRCVVSRKKLDRESAKYSDKPYIIPRMIGGSIDSLKDLVVVSSAVTMRLTKQKGRRMEDKTRCVIHALESAAVRDRIRAAHERLERIELAEKRLREEEAGTSSPTSPLDP